MNHEKIRTSFDEETLNYLSDIVSKCIIGSEVSRFDRSSIKAPMPFLPVSYQHKEGSGYLHAQVAGLSEKGHILPFYARDYSDLDELVQGRSKKMNTYKRVENVIFLSFRNTNTWYDETLKIGASIAKRISNAIPGVKVCLDEVSVWRNGKSIIPLQSNDSHLLMEDMGMVQDIVSLGLSVRKNYNIKVRQPLGKIEISMNSEKLGCSLDGLIERLNKYKDIIQDEVNVKEVIFSGKKEDKYDVKPNYKVLGPKYKGDVKNIVKAINEFHPDHLAKVILKGDPIPIPLGVGKSVTLNSKDDFIISVRFDSGSNSASNDTFNVILDTEITKSLKEEGLFREILSKVQGIRKDMDLKYTSRIIVGVDGDDTIKDIIKNRSSDFMKETLTNNVLYTNIKSVSVKKEDVNIDGHSVSFYIMEDD